jgi:hypothetical protein
VIVQYLSDTKHAICPKL